MNGFIYRWTNTINGKWYIGSHKGVTNDGYRHSSQVMLAAEKKYGLENFVREILFEGDYEKDQIKMLEAKHLNKEDAANNKMSYNRTNMTGPNCLSEESKQKIRESLLGRKRKPRSEEWKQNISKARKGQKLKPQSKEHIAKRVKSCEGKMHGPTTDEWKKNISKSNKGRIPWNKGKTTGPRSEEEKRKISESMMGKHKGKSPWNKGKTNCYTEEANRKRSETCKKSKTRPNYD